MVSESDPCFVRFWDVYPNKSAKLDARVAWQSLSPDDGTVDRILAALAWQCRSRQWTKDRGVFIPLPASWLRAERWTDEGTKFAQPTDPAAPDWLDSYCFHQPTCTDSEVCRRLRAEGK